MDEIPHTHLKEGRPCLRIVDAESGQECLHWCCECPPGAEEETAQQEMHRLVSKLLLLSCQQTLCSPAEAPAVTGGQPGQGRRGGTKKSEPTGRSSEIWGGL